MATSGASQSLPNACVARAPKPVSDRASATLFPPTMGFLAVAVHFHGRLLTGLKTNFFRMQDDGSKGAALGDTIMTDDLGIARLQRLVTIGHYICEIEHQPTTSIPTVPTIEDAFPLALPIGRHVAELHDRIQFGRDGDIVDDDASESASDGDAGQTSNSAEGEASGSDWSDAA
jgi:hypothetical protein